MTDTIQRLAWLVLIMTEGALRWHAGSPAVMAGQAQSIADISRRSNVRVGIILWTARG
jgi:hypothetical protein